MCIRDEKSKKEMTQIWFSLSFFLKNRRGWKQKNAYENGPKEDGDIIQTKSKWQIFDSSDDHNNKK